MIPVQNIYYMLSYAFRVLKKTEFSRVSTEQFENIYDMYSSILIKSIETLIKRGMKKGYLHLESPTSIPRGKIMLVESIKQQTIYRNELVCGYDIFSENIVLNQVIKATFLLLLSKNISKESKKRIKNLLLYFSGVEIINIKTVNWTLLQKSDDIRWRMIIGICRLVFELHIQSQREGSLDSINFEDDQQLSRLFEKFVKEYYRIEYPQIQTSSPVIKWKVDSFEYGMLPDMHTDVVLSKDDDVLVIDTKFYNRVLQNRFGRNKLRSAHLYQIYSYVKNMNSSSIWNGKNISGMLLYAKTDEGVDIDQSYSIDGNIIYVKTLDLNQRFDLISCQLNQIADTSFHIV